MIGRKPRTNRDSFYNLRAQKYNDLRDCCWKTYQAVEQGKYFNENDLISFSSEIECLKLLRSELCTIPQKDNGVGKFQILSKQQMSKMGLRSPNAADSVMMSRAIASINKNKRDRNKKSYPKLSIA